jgi:hypothetical protein
MGIKDTHSSRKAFHQNSPWWLTQITQIVKKLITQLISLGRRPSRALASSAEHAGCSMCGLRCASPASLSRPHFTTAKGRVYSAATPLSLSRSTAL